MTLRPFEQHAIRLLLSGRVEQEILDVALGPSLVVSVDETGAGYFATATHRLFPTTRSVFSDPTVTATFEGMTIGFVVFLEKQSLTLECHGLDDAFPPNARILEWKIREAH